MKLVCISDTHGDHEQLVLPAGDVLIHAGDVTGHGTEPETRDFLHWFGSQPHSHKLCVAGNHDTWMEADPAMAARHAEHHGVHWLNDSGCQIAGLRFWGSPITPRFMHWAFMRDPGAPIEAHWNRIPPDTDVLITHGPPYGILDQVERDDGAFEHTGCPSLLKRLRQIAPQVHLFGHIHEGRGQQSLDDMTCFNVASMNRSYRMAHAPVVIELSHNRSGEPV